MISKWMSGQCDRARRVLCRQPPEVQRMRETFELHDLGVAIYEQRMRDENPEARPGEIEAMVRAWLAAPRPGDPPGRRWG